MSENNITFVREKRRLRFEAAQLLASLSSEDIQSGELTWSSLLEMPDWCRWPKQEQQRLLLVSGALFSAPTIRLWIDSERIRKARFLIGDRTFRLVLKNDVVPQNMNQLMGNDNIEDLFLTTGASVLLGCTPKALRQYVGKMLPLSAGSLPYNIAQVLLSEALTILSEVNKINESQKNEQADMKEQSL